MWVLSVKLTKFAPIQYYFLGSLLKTFGKDFVLEKGQGMLCQNAKTNVVYGYHFSVTVHEKKGQVMLEQQAFSRSLFI